MSRSTVTPNAELQQKNGWLLRLLPSLLRELVRSVQARLEGRLRSREQAALEFVRTHAVEGDAESVLRALDRFVHERRPPTDSNHNKYRALDAVASNLPTNARVLELGSYCGYTTIRMARLMRGGGQVVSIEANGHYAAIARAMCRYAGVEDQVRILVGEACLVIPGLDGPFDLVFMNHRKDEYLTDLWYIEDHLLFRPESIVAADDVGPLYDAVACAYRNYVRNQGRYDPYSTENRSSPSIGFLHNSSQFLLSGSLFREQTNTRAR